MINKHDLGRNDDVFVFLYEAARGRLVWIERLVQYETHTESVLQTAGMESGLVGIRSILCNVTDGEFTHLAQVWIDVAASIISIISSSGNSNAANNNITATKISTTTTTTA